MIEGFAEDSGLTVGRFAGGATSVSELLTAAQGRFSAADHA